jgi:hypothetical protein
MDMAITVLATKMPKSWCAECQSENCTCRKPYRLVSTASGYAVVREEDDRYAEFEDSDAADAVMQKLLAGDADEDDYEWSDESI